MGVAAPCQPCAPRTRGRREQNQPRSPHGIPGLQSPSRGRRSQRASAASRSAAAPCPSDVLSGPLVICSLSTRFKRTASVSSAPSCLLNCNRLSLHNSLPLQPGFPGLAITQPHHSSCVGGSSVTLRVLHTTLPPFPPVITPPMSTGSIRVSSKNLKAAENKTKFSITIRFLNYKKAFKRSETEKRVFCRTTFIILLNITHSVIFVS